MRKSEADWLKKLFSELAEWGPGTPAAAQSREIQAIDWRSRNGYVAMDQKVRENWALSRSAESVTELLAKWRGGNQEALQDLIPVVYKELHVLAHHYLRAERSGHTLQSTALVHEAYLRLVDQRPIQIQNRAHFVAVAARLMRQILVDYARRRRAAKRGPECKVELDESFDLAQKEGVDVLGLDDALVQLSRRDAQQGRIVEMRFFGGLTVEETAEALDVSAATVKRDWNMAKAWLTREMQRGASGRNQAVGEG
jgi:RNA polymerase sigma factor (TIGR02999 family)